MATGYGCGPISNLRWLPVEEMKRRHVNEASDQVISMEGGGQAADKK